MSNSFICLIILYILLLIFSYYTKEKFNNVVIDEKKLPIDLTEIKSVINESELNPEKKQIYVLLFLTKRCPACINYDTNIHDKVVEQFKDDGDVTIKKIYGDNDPDNLFDKFNVQYIPTCYVVNSSNDQSVKTDGVLPSQISNAVESVK